MFATAERVRDYAEVLGDLRDLLAELGELDPQVATGRERREALVELQALSAQVEAQRVRVVAAADRNLDAQTDGALTLQVWLNAKCNSSKGAASRDVRTARRLDDFDDWAEAFAAGEVSRAHVDLWCKAARPERLEGFQRFSGELLSHAKLFAPDAFAKLVGRLCELIDDDRGAKDAWDDIERRRLHLSTTLGGMGVLDGTFDPESTAVVNAALEYHMADDDEGAADTRTIAQRRADALVSMSRFTLAHAGEKSTRRAGRPAVVVTVDMERLCGASDIAALRDEIAGAGRLSTETLLRLTCDCSVSRVLTVGKSEILDVGRQTRTIAPAMWRALLARDGGCTHPGCHAPLWALEAHHVQHWAHGGETNLDNLELRCWRHHRNDHEGSARST